MKPSRRIDLETPRRDSRERDVSHAASNSSRFNRKRPSMLSEFHGSKYHNHSIRDVERDGDIQHYRSHNRYLREISGGSNSTSDYAHSFTPPGFHSSKVPKSDSRNRHSHHHNQHRSSSHHHHSNNYHHGNSTDLDIEEDVPVKRPRLMMDAMWKTSSGHVDNLNNADSPNSSSGDCAGSSAVNSLASGGLSAYEDIVSDDDDSLLRDENDKKMLSKSPTPIPVVSPQHLADNSGDEDAEDGTETPNHTRNSYSEVTAAPSSDCYMTSAMPSKEELLTMMDKVDRDIAAVETQISALQKRQAELEETAKLVASNSHSGTPHSSMSVPSSTLPSPSQHSSSKGEADEGVVLDDVPTTPPFSPENSQLDAIFYENKSKAKSSHSSLNSLNFPPLPGLMTLYHQPSEALSYHHNILSHQLFQARLVQFVRERKIRKHQKELALCEEYDSQMAKWEKSVERIEANPKKRMRDQKNRELFERCFPELKVKREQQERLTRVDQRGYGTVRSDAELKEIMYELCEQEEAPVRHRRTHAVIPPMLIEERDKRVQFCNKNGLITDPMGIHRESRFLNMWSREEKAAFKDKYMFNPKDFGAISLFLPNKTPTDCVQYYYLSKKREKFKHMVRKANFKRKKPFIKPPEFSNPSLAPPMSLHHTLPLTLFASAKPKNEGVMMSEQDNETAEQSDYGDWSTEDISSLKEGLRKCGRVWAKIYREVRGRKTATQCKQFYDKYCIDKELGLSAALAEHSSRKNAEKMRRKADCHMPVSPVVNEAKKVSVSRQKPPPAPQRLEETADGEGEEVDSENTESAYETESKSDESGSESTITDSGPEESSSSTTLLSSSQQKSLQGGKKSKSASVSSTSGSGFKRSSEEALDLFISAAEALNNIVPPEVALHDHNYALPPSSLVSSMELQGTSGLSLIAAAAAVVSPTLARSAGGNKVPSLSPVRAPRGRPPNSQRKGSSNATSKLAPTLLSPAGSSSCVLLTDVKTGSLRGRTRSAPSDRPKMSTLHIPRTSSLARMSINSTSRAVVGGRGGSNSGGLMPPASYSKHKTDSNCGPSLKSMIAFHPTSSASIPTSLSSTSTTNSHSSSSTSSAFEALVNVAVAAPPAELPNQAPSSHFSSSSSLTSTNSKHSSSSSTAVPSPSPSSPLIFTSTAVPSSQQPTVTLAVTGSNSNASNSTGQTAYLDVNQAINFLASLAQQQVVSGSSNGNSQSISVLPTQRLYGPVNFLGNIVAPKTNSGSGGGGGLISSNLSSSKGGKALSMSAWSDTLLGHLTSGISSHANSSKTVQNKATGKVKKVAVLKQEGSLSRTASVPSTGHSQEQIGRSNSVPSTSSTTAGVGVTNTTTITTTPSIKTGDELSNLNLLSSLVAAVAASSQPTSSTSPHPLSSTTSKATMGQSCNVHGNKTELKRMSNSGSAPAAKGSSTAVKSAQKMLATSASLLAKNTPISCSSYPTASTTHSDTKQDQEQQCNVDADQNSSVKRPLLMTAQNTHNYSTDSDDLPRSVVRSALGSAACNSSSDDHLPAPLPVDKPKMLTNNSTTNTSVLSDENDMTSSLASIIPSCYNPSMSSQSSLLLYTRSLSFPMSMAGECSVEEEDHLASATRGISELSKLLGTDSDSGGSRSKQDSPVYKDTSSGGWNPSDLLTTPSLSKTPVGNTEEFVSDKPAYLSSMLESQVHGTVHHTPLTSSKLASTTTNSTSINNNRDSTLDVDRSR